jgi:hypothetical protein
MPTIRGTFNIASPGPVFSSRFHIDEIGYSFNGSFGGLSIDSCKGVVTLTYDTTEQLTSSRDYQGVVGKMSMKMTLANGVEIAGPLDNPIMVANTVTGNGRWGVTRADE